MTKSAFTRSRVTEYPWAANPLHRFRMEAAEADCLEDAWATIDHYASEAAAREAARAILKGPVLIAEFSTPAAPAVDP